MSIVISDSIVLSFDETAAGIDLGNPRIGYHSLVTAANLFSDEEAAGFPLTNLGNAVTHLKWRGETTSEQAVGIDLGSSQTVNYVGIAKHNFGSDGVTVQVQSSDNGSDWTDVTSERLLPNDFAYMEEFEDVTARYFRVLLGVGSVAPEMAVLYFGRVLRMQRRLYVGHTPYPFAGDVTVSTGFSESGQFLGRIHRSTLYKNKAAFQNLSPDWVRTYLDPFITASAETPFFWAWRPSEYPDEVGFAWLMSNPGVSNQRANGMMSVELDMQGVR